MKNLKNTKTQILAALALALSLGLVVPTGRAWANTGTSTPSQSDDTATSSDQETNDLADDLVGSVMELVKRIAERDSFEDFRAKEEYIVAALRVKVYTENAETFLKEQVVDTDDDEAEGSYWDNLSPETQALIKDLDAFDAIKAIKQNGEGDTQDDYTKLTATTDRLFEDSTDALDTLHSWMQKFFEKYSDGDFNKLNSATNTMYEAETLPNYDKYVTLHNTLSFFRTELVATGATCENVLAGQTWSEPNEEDTLVYCAEIVEPQTEQLEKTYIETNKEGDLYKSYLALSKAATAIDETVTANLMASEMPETSAGNQTPSTNKPATPDTGIVGLIESGALDLGTLTLIASAAVASIAGLGIIAKLYLKRKF